MLSGIWSKISAALGFIASLAIAAALLFRNQRDNAKHDAKIADQARAQQAAARKNEQEINKARETVRQGAAEVEREQMEAKASGNRPRNFGDKRM